MPPFLRFGFLTPGLFLGLPVEPDMLLNLRYTFLDLLAASQLPADRAQGKGDFPDRGKRTMITRLPNDARL